MKLVEYRIAKKCHVFIDGCIIIIHEVVTCESRNETVFNSDDLILKVLLVRKEPSFKALVTKVMRSSLHSSYYYYCKKPVYEIYRYTGCTA